MLGEMLEDKNRVVEGQRTKERRNERLRILRRKLGRIGRDSRRGPSSRKGR